MVGYYNNQGVPTSAEMETNGHHKKYTVNQPKKKGVLISKPICALMAIGAVLLALLVGLVVFFLAPRYCDTDDNGEAPSELVRASSFGSYKLYETNERLPRNIQPLQYRLQIAPDLENRTMTGSVSITIVPKEDTDTIILNANNLTINKQSLTIKSIRKNSGSFAILHQDYIDQQRYKISLQQALTKDEQYHINIPFSGELNSHLQGFYRSQYVTPKGETKYMASTQFSPTDARRAFPCFDEPSFKSQFTISLARPANMISLSNVPKSRSDLMVERNGWYWDHYPETPKMSTYLVAFLIGELKYLPTTPDNTAIKVWAVESVLPQTQYASEIAPKMFKYFENYFNITVPSKKIDIVAVPEFGFSAMENWGLITFRESSLLLNRDSSVMDQRTVATVLSHEIAHQWFGNLVTPKWWNDLWLKEGFSTYLQYLGVDEAEPSWKILEEFMISETQSAMLSDALESSRSLSHDVINSRQIQQAFDEISYAKGACIIRMMQNFLGEPVFKRGVIKFLNKYQYSNADRDDLFDCLTEESQTANVLQPNETVKQIMDTWTQEAGFPLVTAIGNYDQGTITISQKRFLLTGTKDEPSSWWIPISFTTEANPNFVETKPSFWLKGEPEITEPVMQFGKWYLLNLNQTGYYIVNYDEKNWRALTENIMMLPPLIRAQLVSDSMDLARANLLDYDIPLRLIAKMAVNDHEIMFVPTHVAFDKLRFLSDILSATPAFGLFEEYHKAIFKRTYDLVTLEDNIDHYLTRRIRRTVLEWSCQSPESRCVHQSRSKFRSWMIKDEIVEPNLRETVYCTAIREGGEIEWDFAYRKFLETTSPNERNILLDALGCTKLKWLLSRYTDLLIDKHSSIRIQDADRLFESVAKNKFGTQIAFDFLRTNWNELLERFGDGFNILSKMIKSLAPHMNTQFQLLELERFRVSLKNNISTTTNAFDSVIETVKSNVAWMDKNYEQVEDWLKKYKDHFLYL